MICSVSGISGKNTFSITQTLANVFANIHDFLKIVAKFRQHFVKLERTHFSFAEKMISKNMFEIAKKDELLLNL